MGEFLTAVLLLVGGCFVLLGSVGLARLPDFFTRLHAPTKATTLGLGTLLAASVLHHGAGVAELLIAVFAFISAPVSAYLMGQLALARARRQAPGEGDSRGGSARAASRSSAARDRRG